MPWFQRTKPSAAIQNEYHSCDINERDKTKKHQLANLHNSFSPQLFVLVKYLIKLLTHSLFKTIQYSSHSITLHSGLVHVFYVTLVCNSNY